MKGWALVMRCADANMAPLVQSRLEAQGIESILLNKQDSSYVGIPFASAAIEIWVPEEQAASAKDELETLDS